MWYHEYALQPELRNGTLLPRSALRDLYSRNDSGYCSVYAFDSTARFAIQAQGDSKGLARFPVYSDRLWIDIDAADSSPQEVERVKAYTRQITRQLQDLDYNFTVWDSGSKGFHICVKIEPMLGKDVPWSQLQYVQHTLKLNTDFSLYQHGRLLSNPGRLHPKTGRKKSKVFEHRGNTTLTIPMVKAPDRITVDSDSLTDMDMARIALSRLGSLILDAPLPGNRHTSYWSVASQCLEAGLKSDLVCGLLCWVNQMSENPKEQSEVERAVKQAAHQLGVE